MLCSASTWTSTTSDYIEYTLQPNSLIASIEIVPYRVYWYPGSPTYGPQRVSFQLFELRRPEDGSLDRANLSLPVYESPVYDVENDMKVTMEWLVCWDSSLTNTVLIAAIISNAQASVSSAWRRASRASRSTRRDRERRDALDGEQPSTAVLHLPQLCWRHRPRECHRVAQSIDAASQSNENDPPKGYDTTRPTYIRWE